jgi:AcrR family transcriptional regulator
MREKLDTEIRQEQIAQAALAVVAQHGLQKLNVARVARRIGLVPSAIYRHFRSKDDIIDAVLHLVRERLLDNVNAVSAEAADPVEQLHRLLLRHVRLIRENHALPRIVFSEEVYGGRPERRRVVFQTMQAYLDRVGEIVAKGQAAGAIRSDLDPGTAAVMFLGLIQPAAILWHVSDGEFDVTRHADRAWKVFVGAIRSHK